ncbi:bifunctional tRNA (5-methylaminomethyl-2-thiouridine)(34)-methyltransferase MnmD/FAD-dependent 5-carboxymethylaminomethyl-2-thiouridine(34) oxidoreductase MnmC [Curvivirga aplysinae]|uniref:bifunctional tRNA (5-methylaminomethyl-2-thiouridine)(34)-methyltransferase MnmD/FAD-dependent 5-carboxymethylaminomethyl-2-thiouridine(34) oxidoreductase MnmC n=1 Tax=Curvivirga aplysinae TaxID=2529852 RepID=UPI0012BC180A|nr:bifunctional tRNA (5-methylaminomethyl-2-thiouridine)(34)-methyltransferase MnmD/FAD-dependent 5-carboxymethylaminomethyl-2-thiouridine(34) oxidoreductase MnmC [Curvivirga aplysinae]MTI11308.1 bifunctional tRNA (5-methylaminomethyl-2-thiouridine)(34)-methyltransferase MnmD/FAD-dependent 5-carboxymethylaminomethyl-2-thiouridine(34) oxidoreductase MnmC [Curvivirga aplysinae]
MASAQDKKLQSPTLKWKDGITPESIEFGDIYFNPTDGLAESRYVFIEGIGESKIWENAPCLVVGETGFGTGLNFLNLWKEWNASSNPDQRLHFLSVEAFPLKTEDIRKALSAWPELSEYMEKLCISYPEIHPGLHRISFDEGRVTLTLLFGSAAEMFPQIQGYVDAWFLDGFAPSQNKSMWTEDLYNEIARLSKPDAKLATFTAAGHVRRGLEAAGFKMSKRPGFGKKRECLSGTFNSEILKNSSNKTPWYAPTQPLSTGKKVALIGGGIAAFMTSHALNARGFETHIYEAAPEAASVGSGNLIGLVQPRLTAADSLDGKFNASAFLHAVRHYSGITGSLKQNVWLPKRGVLQLARTEDESFRFQSLIDAARLPANIMQFVSAAKASEIAKTTIEQDALYFPYAGCVSPRDWVISAAQNHKNFHSNHLIQRIEKLETGWRLHGLADNKKFTSEDYAAIILANGPYADQLWTDWDVPLHAKRGQVVHYKATEKSRKLNCSIAFEGYISPAANITTNQQDIPLHVAGASYANFDKNPPVEKNADEVADWRHLREQDRLDIKENVSKFLPHLDLEEELNTFSGRAGLRATVPDHLAIVGPLPDYEFFEEAYGDLHHGKPSHRYPEGQYHEGLYCLTGLGSRGVQTSPLLAEVLADLMTGEPCALPKDQLIALHPARFQIRKLKRPPHLRDEN